MSDDYKTEDAIRALCVHPSSFILYMRMCTECGKTLEDEVIEPGTEIITHKVMMTV